MTCPPKPTRRFVHAGLVALLAAAAGCTPAGKPGLHNESAAQLRDDRTAPFEPQEQYPGWAYDAPQFVRPVSEPNPVAAARPGDPLTYYVNRRLLHIRRPAGDDAYKLPRLAVYASDGQGRNWRKIGYYGRGQTFFPYEVARDGEYQIRFLGAHQSPADDLPARPDRVYHVDTMLPDVHFFVEPAQERYPVGGTVTLCWSASDSNLVEKPVQVSVLGDTDDWRVLATELSAEGSLAFEVPAAAESRGLQFRIEAQDRAGNVGVVYGPVLAVEVPRSPPPPPETLRVAAGPDARSDSPDAAPPADADTDAIEQPLAELDIGSVPTAEAAAGADAVEAFEASEAPEAPPSDEASPEAAAAEALPVVDAAAVPTPAESSVDPAWAGDESARTLRGIPLASDDPATEDGPTESDGPSAIWDSPGPESLVRTPVWLRVGGPGTDELLSAAPLVPALPGLTEPDRTAAAASAIHRGARPWEVLRRYGSAVSTTIWSLPAPRFLDDLAAYVDLQFRRHSPREIFASPAAAPTRPTLVGRPPASEETRSAPN